MTHTQTHLDTYIEVAEMGPDTIKALTKDTAVVGTSTLVSPSNGSTYQDPYNAPYIRAVYALGNNIKNRTVAIRLAFIYNAEVKKRLMDGEVNGKTVENITASDLFEGAEKLVTILPLQQDMVGDEKNLTDYLRTLKVAATSAQDDSSQGEGSDKGDTDQRAEEVTLITSEEAKSLEQKP